MAADEESVIERLRAIRSDILKPTITGAGGRIIKTMGDGFLIEFTSPVDAVRAAIDVQGQMAEREQGPEDQRLRFRIGVNLGDIVEDDGDVLGDGVNIAARLEALSAPGGACISRTVHDQLRGKIDAELTPMGPQKVKNIPDPIDVWRVEIEGATAPPMQFELPDRPSIVILPFVNMSSDPDQEFFCDGMVEDVTTALSRFSELFVVARSTASTYKSRNVDVREVSRALSVQYVLQGSVRSTGRRLRVSAQLIDAVNDRHVWAEKYDGSVEDIFEFQDELTQSIVGAVAPGVKNAELERHKKRAVSDLSAWGLIVRSRSERMSMTPDGMVRGIALAKKAIAIEPENADGFIAMADCHVFEAIYGWNRSSAEAAALHNEASAEAFKLDRTNEFALISRAHSLLLIGRREEPIALLRRAMEINPNEAACIGNLGVALIWNGQAEEGLELIDKSLRLSPKDPWAPFQMANRSVAAYNALNFEQALHLAEEACADYPNFPTAARAKVAAFGMLGRANEAQTALANLERLLPGVSITSSRLAFLNFREEDTERYLEGLRRAGMPE